MRTKKGLVTSDKMNKTIVVSVHTYKSHPTYKQWDIVVIKETKPTSKLKRWEVVEKK